MISMFDAMGVETGVDMGSLLDVVAFASEMIGRTLDGRVQRAAAASRG
jgi:hypothetical protein